MTKMNDPMLIGISVLTFFFIVLGGFAGLATLKDIPYNLLVEHQRIKAASQPAKKAPQVRERRYTNYTPPTLTPKERAKLKRQALESKPVIQQTKVQKKPVTNFKPVASTQNNAVVKDSIGGLVNLGISKSDAKILVNKVYKPTIKDAGELVSKCFQKMNG